MYLNVDVKEYFFDEGVCGCMDAKSSINETGSKTGSKTGFKRLGSKFALLGFCCALFFLALFLVLSEITSYPFTSKSSQSSQLAPPSSQSISSNLTRTNEISRQEISAASNVNNPLVIINTSVGNLTIELYPEHAPLAVKKLMQLIENNYFSDGAVLESKSGVGFVIAKVNGNVESFENVKDEVNNLSGGRGSIAILKSDRSPAYLNNLFVGYQPQPHIRDLYIVFGQVVEGLDEIEKQSNGSVGRVSSFVIDKNKLNGS